MGNSFLKRRRARRERTTKGQGLTETHQEGPPCDTDPLTKIRGEGRAQAKKRLLGEELGGSGGRRKSTVGGIATLWEQACLKRIGSKRGGTP